MFMLLPAILEKCTLASDTSVQILFHLHHRLLPLFLFALLYLIFHQYGLLLPFPSCLGKVPSRMVEQLRPSPFSRALRTLPSKGQALRTSGS